MKVKIKRILKILMGGSDLMDREEMKEWSIFWKKVITTPM